MSVEIPQHVDFPHETISGIPQSTKEVSQIDHLSRLPPELLDSIFELAADTHTLATVPPSRYLEPYHRRALYRSVSIGNDETLSRLATTLHECPSSGHLIRRIIWKCDYSDRPFLPTSSHLCQISETIPNLREMDFGRKTESIAYLFTVSFKLVGLSRALRVCRFVDARLPSVLAKGLTQLPNLRRIEISFIEWEEAENQQVTGSAPHVTEVVIKSTNYASETRISHPSKLAHFFPNAAFVSVDLSIIDFAALLSVKPLLQQIPPDLRSLILRDRWNDNECDNPCIDEFLPRFPHLRHLHLDPLLYSFRNLKSTLAPLKSLVSLSLAFREHLHPSSLLVDAVRQLPLLRSIKLEYLGTRVGEMFDIELAQSQVEEMKMDLKAGASIPALQLAYDLSEMKGWEFPFGWNASDTLLEVVKIEKELEEELGLVVSSNFEQIRRAYHRQLIEYANRQMGAIYFYGIDIEASYAYHVAKQHGLTLPPLEVDLTKDELLVRNNLEWFKVDMTEAVGDDEGDCIALSLRYKKRGRLEEVEKLE
ncbi:hypothetical protein JCM5350_003902 [Sporobolomyces pararoseus]